MTELPNQFLSFLIEHGMNNFYTLPNLLTMSRVVLLPIFILGFFLKSRTGIALSLLIFVFCCITDYLDGYYARAYKQITKIGQMLDPLADKVLISIAILAIVGFSIISHYTIIPAAITLCRDMVISDVRDATKCCGNDFATSYLSKWKTATQMFSISLILLSSVMNSATLLRLGELIFWLSSITAVISGIIYCRKHIRSIV
ncbi:MAG: CDP-diacylglycerol--glycerol-3-phosphate 3-phosphatidyltransferase [Holosporales bacterium]|jgi:cardiolipin synthase|nr:CDP-diacylglycerol--glycerol-3-phosphate 3-phosphatidyltransferase [Holosporales bacterium]